MRTLNQQERRESACELRKLSQKTTNVALHFARSAFGVRGVLASLSFLLLSVISCWGEDVPFNSATISGLGARNIGSATMSGRISAIAGTREPSGKITMFVGAASGGVWKSDDSGTRYRPVFDEQSAQSIGAIALDPKNSKNVWVGTGETWTRNSVSIGDGIYKSTDGGETWSRAGLEKSERIGRIAVDPRNSETVFAAVPGALWSDSPDRGLYKTTDGGKTWNQVLKGPNLSTGCTDVAIDSANPDIMFAAMWDFRRKGWEYRSGGESPTAPSASGLFRSTDGGNTWTEVTADANNGFPKKPYGRLAVAIAPSNPKRVYAFVESPESALFVSDDGGATWDKRDKSQWMVWRPFYFANLIVDPKNPDRLFKPDGSLIVSEDGGKSFAVVGGFQGAHGDAHDVWIDPTNTQVVFVGDDGGMWYSYNGGSKWWKGENLPVSQFYHVSVDDNDPYRVYGGLQDNSSWVGDSQYPGGITNSRWENMYNGDGFWMFSDPADPNYIYAEYQGGEIGRVNRYTHEGRDIKPRPNYKEKLRFNWNTPIALSPNEKGTIYIGAQFLFRSRDHGQTWDRISPDLTTNDPEKQKQEQSGGVTVDNSSAEMHTTIYSISESPKQKGLIWVGTDDGNIQLTRDGGKTWNNVVGNVPGMLKNSWVNWVQASNFNPGTAYATFDLHTFGDMRPYAYKSTDFGATWTPLVAPDSPVRGYAHVIKEDLVNPNLLFLGTELGLWVSVDGGRQWAHYKGGDLPAVAVRDLAIHPRDHDLVIATHGRGIWIVDDISPLRALTPEVLASPVAFLPGRPTVQRLQAGGGWANGDAMYIGPNPPDDAVITYYQRRRHIFGDMKLAVYDASGKLLGTLPTSKRRGLNRATWSMRLAAPRVPPAASAAFGAAYGPRVLPGTYAIKMTKDTATYSTQLVLVPDPRASHTDAERRAAFDLALKMSGTLTDMTFAVERMNATRQALDDRAYKLPATDALARRLHAASATVDSLRKKIVATKEGGMITGEERLRENLTGLYGNIIFWDGGPTQDQTNRAEALARELADVSRDFDAWSTRDLAGINSALRGKKLEPIVPMTRQNWESAGN